MTWLLFIALSLKIFNVLGQEEEPKILLDAEDYRGFPEHFQNIYVSTNTVPGARYYWKRDGVLIDENSKPPFVNPKSTTLMVSGTSDKSYEGTYQFFMETPVGKIAGRNVSVLFTYNGQFLSTDPNRKRIDNVVVGEDTYIRCPEHTKGRNFIYKWGKRSEAGGTRFVDPSKNYIVLNDGRLFFSHLTQKDLDYINSLNVKCGMEASVGKDNRFTWSHVVGMKKIGENITNFGPRIVTDLPQKPFQEGDTISMKCAATGNPLPKYSWRMIDDGGNEKTVEDGKDGVEFEDHDPRILVIKSATRKHSGRYWCTATIGKKNDSIGGRLMFEEKPKWAPPMIRSASPSIYSRHSWHCNATGHPLPTYSWYVNGTLLTNSQNHEIDGGKITFPRLRKEDSGMYECVAQNSRDNIYQTAFLDVQAVKPIFKTNTGKTTLFLNNEGKIECYAYAAPKAKNTWKKDGVVIDTSLSKYELLDNQDLVIKDVSKADMGNYTCTAKNLYGNDVKKIEVRVVGEITFVQEPNSTYVDVGDRVNLFCEAKGEKSLPTPIKYKWNFDGKELKLKSDGGILWIAYAYQLVVLNAQVKQTGVYECIAYIDKPSYAEKRRRAMVIVRGPPEAPDSAVVNGGCGSSTAKLEWKTSRKSYNPITHFIIQSTTSYDPRGNWTTVAENVSASVNQFEVKDLSPYAKYRFRIIAVNAIGRSDPSEPTFFKDCRTPERSPTKCPEVSAEAGRANQLTIKWKAMPLIDHNGAGFKYNLQYSKDKKVWESRNLTYITTNFSVPNAGYYQHWEFKIRGVNNVSYGPPCSGEARSGQDAPKMAPENFKVKNKRSEYVDVEWSPIVVKAGSIDGYKLRYWQNSTTRRRRADAADDCESKETACEEVIIGGTSSSFRVGDLHPAREYTMELSGYNSGGTGPPSTLNVVTADGKPSQPTSVSADVYAKYIRLKWEKPDRPNGIVTGYRVSISGTPSDEKTLGPEERSFLFDGLEPERDYVITVQARTRKGLGKPITVPLTTKKEAVPAKPKAPLAEGTGEDAVNVTFQEGTSVQGFPEKFYTVYREKGSNKEETSKQQWLIGDGSLSFIVVPGLDRTKEYEFATVAINDFGESERSDFNSSYPGEQKPVAQSSTPVYKRDWFVALVVVVCFLLIILLVLLLITRKRGERYPVGKRERKRAGILDDAEEVDPDSYPMKPPRTPVNGLNRNSSAGSLPNKDPDRDSLDDYGEDRFGEDAGSLIGEYNDDRKPISVEGPEFV